MRTETPQVFHVATNGRLYYPVINTNDQQPKLTLMEAIRVAEAKNAETHFMKEVTR